MAKKSPYSLSLKLMLVVIEHANKFAILDRTIMGMKSNVIFN